MVKDNSKPKAQPAATKIIVQPSISISYDGKEFEDVKFQEHSIETKNFGPSEFTVTPTKPSSLPLQSSLPPFTATSYNEDKRPRSYATFKSPKAQKTSKAPQSYNNVISNDEKLNKQLSALIGQTPTEQLKGLTNLLHQEQGRMNGNSKESTSPILFHPPQLLPEQTPQSSYTVVYENGKEYEFASYPEHPSTSSQFVSLPKKVYNQQNLKTHTPITEQYIENFESYKSDASPITHQTELFKPNKVQHLGKHPV